MVGGLAADPLKLESKLEENILAGFVSSRYVTQAIWIVNADDGSMRQLTSGGSWRVSCFGASAKILC
jgi:hypothetical protein